MNKTLLTGAVLALVLGALSSPAQTPAGKVDFEKQILPIFKERKIACYQWGLVKGRTQTHLPWPNIQRAVPEFADTWFHDLLEADGSPYNEREVALIQSLTTE